MEGMDPNVFFSFQKVYLDLPALHTLHTFHTLHFLGKSNKTMVDAVDEVLNRIELQKVERELPEGIKALELLQLAYRGKVKLTPQQTRCATEASIRECQDLSGCDWAL